MENIKYNTNQSNIVIMFYRNLCIAIVVGLLFWIGLGSRDKLVPNELVEPLKKSFANAKAAKNAITAATASTASASTAT